MKQKLIQINFAYSDNMPRADLEKNWSKAAEPIGNQAGLVWKIWIINEANKEGGGWYLFETEALAQAYLESEIVSAFRVNPGISNLSVKLYDAALAPTVITRGPIER